MGKYLRLILVVAGFAAFIIAGCSSGTPAIVQDDGPSESLNNEESPDSAESVPEAQENAVIESASQVVRDESDTLATEGSQSVVAEVALSDEEAVVALQALGFYNYTADELQDQLVVDRARMAEIEEFIVDCMRLQGFSYFPSDPSISLQLWSGFEHQFGTQLWAERYGFGLTTLSFLQHEVEEPLVGAPEALQPQVGNEDSAEAQYIESLGEEGRSAYFAALYDNEDACDPAARQTVPEFEETGRIDVNEFDLLDLRSRVVAAPEYVRAEREASECLSTAGYEVENEDQAKALVEDEVFKSGFGNDAHLVYGVDSVTLSPEGAEALHELQTFEREVAAAMWDCGAMSRQLNAVAEGIALRLVSEQVAG